MAGYSLADQGCGFHGAHNFSRKNVNLAGGAFLRIENPAVMLRIVFDYSDREPSFVHHPDQLRHFVVDSVTSRAIEDANLPFEEIASSMARDEIGRAHV